MISVSGEDLHVLLQRHRVTLKHATSRPHQVILLCLEANTCSRRVVFCFDVSRFILWLVLHHWPDVLALLCPILGSFWLKRHCNHVLSFLFVCIQKNDNSVNTRFQFSTNKCKSTEHLTSFTSRSVLVPSLLVYWKQLDIE